MKEDSSNFSERLKKIENEEKIKLLEKEFKNKADSFYKRIIKYIGNKQKIFSKKKFQKLINGIKEDKELVLKDIKRKSENRRIEISKLFILYRNYDKLFSELKEELDNCNINKIKNLESIFESKIKDLNTKTYEFINSIPKFSKKEQELINIIMRENYMNKMITKVHGICDIKMYVKKIFCENNILISFFNFLDIITLTNFLNLDENNFKNNFKRLLPDILFIPYYIKCDYHNKYKKAKRDDCDAKIYLFPNIKKTIYEYNSIKSAHIANYLSTAELNVIVRLAVNNIGSKRYIKFNGSYYYFKIEELSEKSFYHNNFYFEKYSLWISKRKKPIKQKYCDFTQDEYFIMTRNEFNIISLENVIP